MCFFILFSLYLIIMGYTYTHMYVYRVWVRVLLKWINPSRNELWSLMCYIYYLFFAWLACLGEVSHPFFSMVTFAGFFFWFHSKFVYVQILYVYKSHKCDLKFNLKFSIYDIFIVCYCTVSRKRYSGAFQLNAV